MQVRSLALWAAVGMVLSSAGALAVPTPRPAGPVTVPGPVEPLIKGDPASGSPHFTAGQTLTVDARLAHGTLADRGRGGTGETYLFASVAGTEGRDLAAPPLNLALVVDRSGSMKGERIKNAIAAAAGTVDRMRDGDTVTVVTFDTEAQVIVPPTEVTVASRGHIQASIRAIRLGGDTCISCGLEEAMFQLRRAPAGMNQVARVVLLSDGATNHGVRDIPGLRALAGRLRDQGATLTTIGVDVDFDEKVMAALAQEANGRHYFVRDPSGLPSIFAQEFDALVATVARDAEMTLDLAPGVELAEVFDRAFHREGSRVVVPFGTFSAKEEKTVLLRLRVPVDRDGQRPVVRLALRFRDFVQKNDGAVDGLLGLRIVGDGSEAPDMDPFVAARLARSRTSKVLTTANVLFEEGRVNEARDLLQGSLKDLRRDESKAQEAAKFAAAPKPKASRALAEDFESQRAAVARAEANFAPPPPPPANADPAASLGVAAASAGGRAKGEVAPTGPSGRPGTPAAAAPSPSSRDGKAAVRQNQQSASDLAF